MNRLHRTASLVAIALLMFSCFSDTAYLSLQFDISGHERLKRIDLGSWSEPRLVFEDHDVYPWVRFQQSFALARLDAARAARIRAGSEALPMDMMIRFSPVHEVSGNELLAVNISAVTARQGDRSVRCQPVNAPDGSIVRASLLLDAGGAVPARTDSGDWSPKRTNQILHRCDIAYAPFQLVVDYSLEKAGKAEPSQHRLEIPFIPAKFIYQQYNSFMAGCMSA
jgi:hypothetical protein